MGKRVGAGGFGDVDGGLGTWVLVSVPAVVGMRHGVPACGRWGWVERKPGRLGVLGLWWLVMVPERGARVGARTSHGSERVD
jgi:hypothetical protein